MEGRLLLKDCAIFSPDGRVKDRMAVVIDGGKIAAVEPDAQVPVRGPPPATGGWWPPA
jgi:5-methylthioadenosine/S-adenosylhomocysteine deaminase